MPIANPAATAPYATRAEETRGRLFQEPESATRTAFQRDRDRIIHSGAFRRLKYKTQVFVYHEGDNYRTRLSHSLEVSQIARSVARVFGLDEDLSETLALAHDLGHTPFGHAGETALDSCMRDFGGFDHNAQTLRIVTKLEHRYARFDGLNLTWETLEGLVKHNGPVVTPGRSIADLPRAIAEYAETQDLELATYAGPEAQVAALADDIAYNNHDIDDGLRAGLFDIEDLMALPLVGDVFQRVMDRYPGLETTRVIHEAVRELIGTMIEDLLSETRSRLAEARPRSAADVRAMSRPLVGFTAEMTEHNAALKAFLFERMYRHYRVNRSMSKAQRIVRDLFSLLHGEPDQLAPEWQAGCDGPGGIKTARRVCDFIAGMTDKFAIEEHARLFDLHDPRA
ncbi:putative deoxyguanosinetriphosphate triphosphohydrolase [Parvibaculum lavamentivorans DS-1]|uniref:Deoxyguanosinetriphosphate triphosphohydrolase-like protein n=1 Tax=Parvibaculum lavamentivorans (strain DS-1 / DSM 13023 / NCIMB 13966) TaxID=402881 RepID=DGTL1_PARL1|nr:deoxyguanosinetriphosphate triphosphohydrolase [Parvibaculum lavamentivorans]A7HXJ5.1 RecName: Full=Deoxyguanosinetriphosphate triphosphohydrolase-like protein [Parvibaculum lavamentivorans DS-1]ABS64628.1 putative deoxyguanosinetriphosphate triphosphohydrolase [Parvibaculum lavamentivorans DS-1]